MDAVCFYGLSLATLPGLVMSPRPASEGLVGAAVERVGDAPARVVDVGTGSGAVAVAIAVGAPNAEVWATDVNPAATVLARLNARRLGVCDRVHVKRGDLLAPAPHELDLVVANLPYLPIGDRAAHPGLSREPLDSVFAAGDGLDLCRRMLVSAEERLVPSGAVILQLHRRVLVAERGELADLRKSLPSLVPRCEPAAVPAAAPLVAAA